MMLYPSRETHESSKQKFIYQLNQLTFVDGQWLESSSFQSLPLQTSVYGISGKASHFPVVGFWLFLNSRFSILFGGCLGQNAMVDKLLA